MTLKPYSRDFEKAMTPQEFQKAFGTSPFTVDKINDPQVKAAQGFDVLSTLSANPAFQASEKQAKKGNIFNQLGGIIKDVPDDFQQMGSNIRQRFGERSEATGENIARRMEDGSMNLKEQFATGFDWATDTIRGAAIVIEEGGLFALKQFTTQEQEQAISQSIANAVQSGMEAVEGTKLESDVKKLVAGYNKIKEENPELIGAAENVAQILGTAAEAFGIGKGTTYGTKALNTASDVIKNTAPKVQPAVESLARQAGGVVDATMQARRATQLAAQEQKVETAVSRILQAGDNPKAVQQATRALSDIDTADIKTYDELNNKLTDRITALSKGVDERLAQDANLYKPAQLAKTTKVGDEIVTEDAVVNAIKGLENAYDLSGEPVNAARLRQLASKYENEGLSLVELNGLAREYGIEFKNRAFTRIGEPKQGYNADLYENTRKALKTTVREQMPDDLAKQLDAKMSDIYSTLDLTKKIENTVAKLEQRITNRTLGQKFGGALANTLDLLTLGSARGFVNKLIPSNVGNKTMNSLDIQAELQKNLGELQRLSEIKNDKAFSVAFEQYAKNMQPGMSIRSSVRPDLVASKIDREDFKKITRIIDEPESRVQYEDMLRGMGLQNASNDELVSFLKNVVDEYEGVATREVVNQ